MNNRSNVYILAKFDVSGIQQYIFGTNRLRENVGASCQVTRILEEFLPESIKEERGSPQEYVLEWQKEENLLSSRIIFEEAVVNGGHRLPLARIAIDRFTGGTVEGALFEEMPWVGGNVMIRIRWKKGNDNEGNQSNRNKIICGLLLWAIFDLYSGILSIGGETSVGRGIFHGLESQELLLDGKALNENKKNEYMQAAALWCKGVEDGTEGK